jgi:hypothetical protein
LISLLIPFVISAAWLVLKYASPACPGNLHRSCKVCGKNSAVLVHASQEPPGELRHTWACGDLGLYVGMPLKYFNELAGHILQKSVLSIRNCQLSSQILKWRVGSQFRPIRPSHFFLCPKRLSCPWRRRDADHASDSIRINLRSGASAPRSFIFPS